jgi:hypothetical protein
LHKKKWDEEKHFNQGYPKPAPGEEEINLSARKYQNTPFGAVSGPHRNSKYNTFGITDKSKFF